MLDPSLAAGVKNGYVFDLVGDGNIPDASYTLTATPEAPGVTGMCIYTSSQSAQIERGAVAVNSGLLSAGATGTGCTGHQTASVVVRQLHRYNEYPMLVPIDTLFSRIEFVG